MKKSVLCLALGRPVLDGSCRLFTRFGGVKTAVIRLPVDNAEHALFVCAKWCAAWEAHGQAVGADLTPDTMVPVMLQSERFWTLIESFVTLVMRTRELDGRRERNNREGQ